MLLLYPFRASRLLTRAHLLQSTSDLHASSTRRASYDDEAVFGTGDHARLTAAVVTANGSDDGLPAALLLFRLHSEAMRDHARRVAIAAHSDILAKTGTIA